MQANGVSRGSIYNYFTYHNLDWEIIDKIGRIIGHDFHLDFPDMPIFLTENKNESVHIVEEPAEPYTGYTHQKCIEELNIWKNKYINLLEEHNQILRNTRK